MKILRLSDPTEVAVPEATRAAFPATALRRPPLPRTHEHDSVGYAADLRDPLLGSA